MQLKLLNFYKVFLKFSSNIIGAFISLIIYKSTGSFAVACLYLTVATLLKPVFTLLLTKPIQKKPQFFLLLRIVPFVIYSTSLLLLDTNLQWLGIVLVMIFQALTITLQEIPMEIVFSYATANNVSSANGKSRVLEYVGVISAIILGGLFLDNLEKWIVILIACITYLIGVVPLFVYYIKNRGKSGFNKEVVSNAVETFKDIRVKRHQKDVISKKILRRYFLIYFAFCVYDALMSVVGLYIFKISASSYSFVSYIKSAFYASFAIGCYVAGLLDEKKDLTGFVSFACVTSGVLVCIVPFVATMIWLDVILFAIIGFLYSFISIFCYSRMTTKCKIIGVSNRALMNRTRASWFSTSILYTFLAISPVLFIPTFIIIGTVFASCSIFIPKNEEKTRKLLVDFLENNKMY